MGNTIFKSTGTGTEASLSVLPPTAMDPENDDHGVKNPLLIKEIADNILSYLDHIDLVVAFDVCQLWRNIVPEHNINLCSTRPPVVISGDMSDSVSKTYLDTISKHPSFKATKFCFKDADLDSPEIMDFLAQNGSDMEEVEVKYEGSTPFYTAYYGLEGYILDHTPNLKALILTDPWDSSLKYWSMSLDPNRPRPSLANHNLTRGLTKLKISTDYGDPHRHDYDQQFLLRIIANCPRLEELEFTDANGRPLHDYFINLMVTTLIDNNRFVQLRSLKFGEADPRSLYPLIRSLTMVSPNQLHTFAIPNGRFRSSRGPPSAAVHLIPHAPHFDAILVEQLLNQHSKSLKVLELPLDGLTPRQLTLPFMPNLLELKMAKAAQWLFPQTADEVVLLGSLNYATHFPKLRVIGLTGQIRNFYADEIYPVDTPRALSVQVLQELPVGVDQSLMARIGDLFPNLQIIRVVIPTEFESLLVSIWKFCPNVTQLFLTFGMDGGAPQVQGLDSLFSGIPEAECRRIRRLRNLSNRKLAGTDFGVLRQGRPSLLNLKGLTRLCLDGPSCRLGGFCDSGAYRHRGDQLTDIFGYSTLAAARELVFFQARTKLKSVRRHGLVKLSPDAVQHICHSVGLEEVVKVGDGTPAGFDPNYLRLIRPAVGLEALGPVPMEWYGLPEVQCHYNDPA